MNSSRLNPSLVLSLIALVMATAGTGWAALGDGAGAQTAGNAEGEPVEIQVRNRSRGETGLVTSSDDYSLRLSNTREGGGGGAVYGCRAPHAEPAADLACLYADNLRGGEAFLFRSRQGQSVGHFDLGNPAGAPFTTNATGLVQNLNADKVDGLDASQLAGAQGPPGPQGPAGSQGPAGPQGEPGPSEAFSFSDSATTIPWGVGEQVVASLSLPAGSYVLNGHVSAENDHSTQKNVSCRLTLAGAGVALAGPVDLAANAAADSAVLALTGAGTLASPGLAELRCAASDITGEWRWRALTAVRVADLN